MTEHFLEQEQLAGVVAAHHHLVISERLSECVCRHAVSEAAVLCDTF